MISYVKSLRSLTKRTIRGLSSKIFSVQTAKKNPQRSSTRADESPSEIDEILRDLVAASEERMEREAKQRNAEKSTSQDSRFWS